MAATVDLLKALRFAGLTQLEIQRRTGIPQARLSRWGAGYVPVGADDALRLHELHASVVGIKPPIGTPGAPLVPATEQQVRDAA